MKKLGADGRLACAWCGGTGVMGPPEDQYVCPRCYVERAPYTTAARVEQDTPGVRCPECGATVKEPEPRFRWDWIDTPHEDKAECIRHLRERLESVERTLERHNF